MKLRTTQNSIRIRIRKSEIEIIKKDNVMEQSISFPSGVVFRFALSIDQSATEVTAVMNDNRLNLILPSDQAQKWIETNQVGIESFIQLPDNEKLHLLVEKDFPCLDRPEENWSDTFHELAPENPESC